MSEIWPDAEFNKVFQNISPDDILQGGIGNCYLISVLSVMAQMPNLITRVFRTKKVNKSGIYEVPFLVNGEHKSVIIDDYLPVYTDKCPYTPFQLQCRGIPT